MLMRILERVDHSHMADGNENGAALDNRLAISLETQNAFTIEFSH